MIRSGGGERNPKSDVSEPYPWSELDAKRKAHSLGDFAEGARRVAIPGKIQLGRQNQHEVGSCIKILVYCNYELWVW